MKLNKKMKVDAIIKATQVKFKDEVETLEKKLKNFVLDYYLNDPENKKAIEWYNSVPDEYKRYIHAKSGDLCSYKIKGENDIKRLYSFYTKVQAYVPYGINNMPVFGHLRSLSGVAYGKPVILVNNEAIESKEAENLQKEYDKLTKKINGFIADLTKALDVIKTKKVLEKELPNLVKFFKFPELKTNTALVDVGLKNKINTMLANV